MAAVTRIICPECLRSVDQPSDASSQPDTRCPHCGAPLEITTGSSEASEPDLDSPLPLDLALHDFPWESAQGSSAFISQTIGRFQLRETLGGGGFGQVYRAYDPRLDREVALKVTRDRNPSARAMERFFREARIAAQLDHPNIIPLHDSGRDDNRCWIAYQFVAGPTLARLMETSTISHRKAAEITLALAQALQHAHSRGIYHRDLKPSNILIDSRNQPRLTDFGLALRDSNDPTITNEGVVLGTPAYMSPEQAAGFGHNVDACSDVYSLGIILYEILCGHRPSDLPSSLPAWRKHTCDDILPPRKVQKSIPRALDRICQRALANEPDHRYRDAVAMAADLSRFLRVSHPARRRETITTISLSAFAVAASFTALVASMSKPAPAPAPQSKAVQIAPAPIAAPSLGPPYVANLTRQTIHQAGCRTLGQLNPEHQAGMHSLEAATKAGLRPCTICLPRINE